MSDFHIQELNHTLRDIFGVEDASGLNHLEAVRSALGEGDINVAHALVQIAEALTRIADAVSPKP